MKKINTTPDIAGLNQLQISVLIQKYICILAMLNYGTKEEKNRAREMLKKIDEVIPEHINEAAMNQIKVQYEEVGQINVL